MLVILTLAVAIIRIVKYMLHSYFTKVENFGQENFGKSIVICQNILPPKFCTVQQHKTNENEISTKSLKVTSPTSKVVSHDSFV